MGEILSCSENIGGVRHCTADPQGRQTLTAPELGMTRFTERAKLDVCLAEADIPQSALEKIGDMRLQLNGQNPESFKTLLDCLQRDMKPQNTMTLS